jgi:hypothetical protein
VKRAKEQHGFTWDPDAEKEEQQRSGFTSKCTEETLLAFIAKLGRMPTLAECKKEFGGIIGALTIGWKLQDEGRFPRL